MENSYYQQDLYLVASQSFIPWQKLENKSLLITGAGGLIGSFLLDVLMFRNESFGSNMTVYALTRNTERAQVRFQHHWNNPLFHHIEQDIINKIQLSDKVDFIIHTASNAYPASFIADPVGTIKANLWGIDNLLDYGLKCGVERTLFVSSGEVYGEGDGKDFTESYSGYINCLTPRSCYPSGKRVAETLCASYIAQYNMDIVIARPCHIYGPTMTKSDDRAFAQFIRKVLEKQDVVLKSKGDQCRSYCYVADCISALLMILLKGEKGNAYNIANKHSNVTVAELAQTIAHTGGQKVVFQIPSSEEEKGFSGISRAVLDAGKLENLGWQANYSIREGIERTIQILSQNNHE